MKNRYHLIFSIITLLITLFLTSCGTTKEEVTEITLIHGWGTMEENHVAMRQIYEDFEKKNTDIRLNLISMTSSEQVISKANDMLSVGKIPDIIFTSGIGVDSFYKFMINKGYALDLMPYVDDDKEFAANLSPSILKYWKTKDNKLYSISDVLLLSGYWYNETIFNEAGVTQIPKTWHEMLDACAKIKEWSKKQHNEVLPIQLNSEAAISLADVLMISQGANSKQKIIDNTFSTDGTEFSNVVDQLKELYEYSYNDNDHYTYRDILSGFNNSKSAIYINGVWADALINNNIPAKYAPFPSENGDSVACISACLGYVLGNTKNPKQIDASVRFIKYMLSDEVQNRILVETGQIPSNPAIDISKFKDDMPRLFQAVETVQSADIKIEIPVNLWSNKKMQAFKDNIEKVIKGNIDNKKFLQLINEN